MDQIDTIERLGTELKYGVKDRDQICSLPSFFLDKTLMDIWWASVKEGYIWSMLHILDIT